MGLPSLAQSPGFIVSDRAEAFAANLEYLLRICVWDNWCDLDLIQGKRKA